MDASRSADTRAADGDDALAAMSPAAGAWFAGAFEAPTPAQIGAWKAIRSGDSALVIAPRGRARRLQPSSAPSTSSAPATPPKADRRGTADQRALHLPAESPGRGRTAQPAGATCGTAPGGSAAGRPTSRHHRGAANRGHAARRAPAAGPHPPDILITTPESLFLLLTSAARESLRGVRTVIIDEIHAVAGTKRGRTSRSRSSGSMPCCPGPQPGSASPPRFAPRRRWRDSWAAAGRWDRRRAGAEGAGHLRDRPRRGPGRARADAGSAGRVGRRCCRGERRVHLAACRGAGRRPHRRAPLHPGVRQLPSAGRAPDEPPERDRRGPRRAGGRRHRARDRPRPPRLGQQGAARAYRGGPEGRAAARRGGDQQPGARHRHGRS